MDEQPMYKSKMTAILELSEHECMHLVPENYHACLDIFNPNVDVK